MPQSQLGGVGPIKNVEHEIDSSMDTTTHTPPGGGGDYTEAMMSQPQPLGGQETSTNVIIERVTGVRGISRNHNQRGSRDSTWTKP